MSLIVALSGYHNSGKTTLGTYVVSELQKRGFRVFVVKSTKEDALLTDREGSDTWRYRNSGAEAVGLLQRELLTLYVSISQLSQEELSSLLQRLSANYDLVILEGFKNWRNIPKIWVLKEGDDIEKIRKQYDNIELFVTIEDKEKVLEHILMKLTEVNS